MSTQPAPETVEQLVVLGRIWGAVRWFHPWVADGRAEWDGPTRDAVTAVLAGVDGNGLRKAVASLFDALDDPATRIVETGEEPEQLHPAVSPPPLLELRDEALGRVAVVSCAAFDRAENQRIESALDAVAHIAAADVAGVIVDLRDTTWRATDGALRVLRRLVAEEIVLPSRRSRQSVGWPTEGGGTDDYHSDFVVHDPKVLEGLGEALTDVPAVVIACSNIETLDAAIGLHAAGRAHLVWVGPVDDDPRGELVDLGAGLQIAIRRSEALRPDGTLGAAPDRVVDASAAGDAVDIAVELLGTPVAGRGALTPPPPPSRHRAFGGEFDDLPVVEERVLGAFKWWNVIRYHFPYGDLLDEPWDHALAHALPDVIGAQDATSYHLSVASFVAAIQDTHAYCHSPVLSRWRGSAGPAVAVRTIEDQCVVTAVGDGADELAFGDVIVTVDGETVAALHRRRAPYLAASTPQALRRRLDASLLLGDEGSIAVLEVDGVNGERRTVKVARAGASEPESNAPVWRVLPEGPGYLDLTRLQPGDVEDALAAVWAAPSIIFDMRGYPNGTAWLIAPRLTTERVVAARFWKPIARSADPDHQSREEFRQRIPNPVAPAYRGRVAVLIDERCISQAEHTCLFFEAAKAGDILFVGSATNGANGDVTAVALPGGITAMFSGHDVRHADGRQLQRVGVQPHVHVEPTIAGVRAGRDEVLEAAVAALA